MINNAHDLARELRCFRYILGRDDQFDLCLLVSILVLEELPTRHKDAYYSIVEHFAHKLQNTVPHHVIALAQGVRDGKYKELSQATTLNWIDHLYVLLPDENDVVLLGDSKFKKCDFFITVDWKTILRFRKELSEIGIEVRSPCQWLHDILPPSYLRDLHHLEDSKYFFDQ